MNNISRNAVVLILVGITSLAFSASLPFYSIGDLADWVERGGHVASGTGSLPATASEGMRYIDKASIASPVEYLYASGAWRALSTAGSPGVTNHALLSNLDFSSSGHTGFASEAALGSESANRIASDLAAIASIPNNASFTYDGLSGAKPTAGSYSHSGLQNLDFSSAGHTGFAGATDVADLFLITASETLNRIASDADISSTLASETSNRLASVAAVAALIPNVGSFSHAGLQDLAFGASGHTGFASSAAIASETANRIASLDYIDMTKLDASATHSFANASGTDLRLSMDIVASTAEYSAFPAWVTGLEPASFPDTINVVSGNATGSIGKIATLTRAVGTTRYSADPTFMLLNLDGDNVWTQTPEARNWPSDSPSIIYADIGGTATTGPVIAWMECSGGTNFMTIRDSNLSILVGPTPMTWLGSFWYGSLQYMNIAFAYQVSDAVNGQFYADRFTCDPGEVADRFYLSITPMGSTEKFFGRYGWSYSSAPQAADMIRVGDRNIESPIFAGELPRVAIGAVGTFPDAFIERTATGTLTISTWARIMPSTASPTSPASGTIWVDGDGIFRVYDQNGSWSTVLTDYPVWQDLRVSLLTTNAGGTNAPTPTVVRVNGGSQGVFAYQFHQTTEQELYCSIQLPHDCYKTYVSPHIHWMPSDSSVGTVSWGIEYTLTNYLATVSAATTIATISAQTNGIDRQHLVSAFPNIDISGAKDSAVLLIRIYRVAGDASDTYSVGAFGTDFDLHYQIRNRGSQLMYGDN